MNNQGVVTSDNMTPLQRAAFTIRELKNKLESSREAQHEPIAIVGMDCRFPGASDLESFWELLRNGVDAICEVPPERWDLNQWFDPNPNAAGKINTRYGGFIADVAGFDAAFFGIPPREAMLMDPGQRLLLQLTWSALERAMIPPESLRGSRTGLFVGMTQNDYGLLQINGDPRAISAYSGTGNGGCFASGRIAFQFGFNGPVATIDTACSSSLVALHQAVSALRQRECDLALVAGVQLNLTPPMQVFFARTQSLSPDGRCFTFDARANGLVFGEGVGVVVVRRLSDAQRDGQPILAVIRATTVNHDGASGGLTVPNESAQEALIRDALQRARISPSTIDYVETHGTATPLGDPIEVGALRAVFGDRPSNQPLRIGSVKTNIGHLNATAAIAGLIKTVLMLQHQQVVPHLHFQEPNPKIPWEGFAVQVPTTPQPWPVSPGQPRRAGLSSFGLSGTNGHLVLEEAPTRIIDTNVTDSVTERPLHLFTLSARSEVALRALAERHLQRLAMTNSERLLANYCHSANAGRSHLHWRAIITCATVAELRDALTALVAGSEHPCLRQTQRSHGQTPKILLILAGNPLSRLPIHPVCHKWLTHYAVVSGLPLDTMVLAGQHTPASELAAYLVLAALWREWGVQPMAVQGAAGGRWAAAVLAGALTAEEAFAALKQGRVPLLTAPQVTLLDGDGSRLTTLSGTGQPWVAIEGYEVRLSLGNASIPEEPTPWPSLLKELASLYLCGGVVDWRGFDAGYTRNWVTLPTYPFARDHYWCDNQPAVILPNPPSTEADSSPALLTTEESVVMETNPVTATSSVPISWSLAQLMEQQLQLVAEAISDVTTQQLAALKLITAAQTDAASAIAIPSPEILRQDAIIPTSTTAEVETTASRPETIALADQPSVTLVDETQRVDPVCCGDWRLLLRHALDADTLTNERQSLAAQLISDPVAVLAASRDALGQPPTAGRRLMLSYQNNEEAAAIVGKADSKRVISATCHDQAPTVIFMFPGVGDHYLHMGQGLYRAEPLFRKIVDYSCDYLLPVIGVDLREVIYPPAPPITNNTESEKPKFDLRAMLGRAPTTESNPQLERLNQTPHSQPLLFIIEYALARLWLARGVRPVAMIGYSIGEYTAAVLSGVMALEDALRLIARRAQLIELVAPGAMLAVPLSAQALQPRLGRDLSLAIHSTPNQSVVAGPVAAIDELHEQLKAQEIVCRRLQSSHAFHSTMLQPLHQPLMDLVGEFRLKPPRIPYVSNVTGDWIRPIEATDPDYWARHTWHTVHFAEGMARLLATDAFSGSSSRLFLEVGPGVSLGSFMLQHPAAAQVTRKVNLPSLRTMYERTADEQFLLNTLGKIYLAGVSLSAAIF
ncbi:Acyltransferase domain-containing protein [Gammaproteobacteria bacterium]